MIVSLSDKTGTEKAFGGGKALWDFITLNLKLKRFLFFI